MRVTICCHLVNNLGLNGSIPGTNGRNQAPLPPSQPCALKPANLWATIAALMRDWFVLAFKSSVVKRSLKYAVVVGSILIAINHSDAILSHTVSFSRFLRMMLTVLVPYTVSTLSSVGTLLEQRRLREAANQSAERPAT